MESLLSIVVLFSSITLANAGWGVYEERFRWPMPIKYVFDADFPPDVVAMIEGQLKAIMDAVPCIKYEKYPNQTMPPYDQVDKKLLYFIKVYDNPAFGGDLHSGAISLGYNPCHERGSGVIVGSDHDYYDRPTSWKVIIHELAHTLGLQHEQDREDAKTYLKNNYTQLPSIYKDRTMSTFGTPYDFYSVTHYPMMNTMDTEIENWDDLDIGQRGGFTDTDVLILKRMYCEPRSCKDKLRECGVNATNGQCQKDNDWATNTCPKSCGKCANVREDPDYKVPDITCPPPTII